MNSLFVFSYCVSSLLEGDMLVGVLCSMCVCVSALWCPERSISTSCQSTACCSCSGLETNDCSSSCVASSEPPWPPIGCGGAWSACTCRRWPHGFCKSECCCCWDTAAAPSLSGSERGCSGIPSRCSATTSRGRWSWAWGARACTGPNTPAPWRVWRCGTIRRLCNGWNAAPCSSAPTHLGGRAGYHSYTRGFGPKHTLWSAAAPTEWTHSRLTASVLQLRQIQRVLISLILFFLNEDSEHF